MKDLNIIRLSSIVLGSLLMVAACKNNKEERATGTRDQLREEMTELKNQSAPIFTTSQEEAQRNWIEFRERSRQEIAEMKNQLSQMKAEAQANTRQALDQAERELRELDNDFNQMWANTKQNAAEQKNRFHEKYDELIEDLKGIRDSFRDS